MSCCMVSGMENSIPESSSGSVSDVSSSVSVSDPRLTTIGVVIFLVPFDSSITAVSGRLRALVLTIRFVIVLREDIIRIGC